MFQLTFHFQVRKCSFRSVALGVRTGGVAHASSNGQGIPSEHAMFFVFVFVFVCLLSVRDDVQSAQFSEEARKIGEF